MAKKSNFRRRSPDTNLIKKSEWELHDKIVWSFIEKDAGKQEVTWYKSINTNTLYGEDLGNTHQPIIIEGLVNYNYFRSWPLSMPTHSGEIDKENCLLLLSYNMLREKGLITTEGYIDLDSGMDRFKIRGKMYKPFGDTDLSQSSTLPQWVMIILKREEISNHEIIT